MKKLTLTILIIGLARSVLAQTPLPDLKVEPLPASFKSTRWPPHVENQDNVFRLAPGDVVTISVEVSNNGQAASGPFTLTVDLSDNMAGTTVRHRVFKKSFANLNPGQRDRLSQDINIESRDGFIRCSAGIFAMEKDDRNVKDNSGNFGTTVAWNSKVVSEYLHPDLEIKLTSPDASRRLTRTVRLLAVVTNKGAVASPMTELLLQCKEKENKVQLVPALKPGESFRHEFQHKWYTLGTKKCTARVDFRNQIDERDESNNQAELSVHIK
jgi:hypothetical protein